MVKKNDNKFDYTNTKKFRNQLQDWSYYQLEEFIKYKPKNISIYLKELYLKVEVKQPNDTILY